MRRVTLSKEMVQWIKEALRSASKDTLKLQENRLNSLQNQYDRINGRLSRLYDAKFDGEVDKEIFQAKENEYKVQLIEIKSQMTSAKARNPNWYEDGCRTLELSNRLHSLYVKANYVKKAQLLKLIASKLPAK